MMGKHILVRYWICHASLINYSSLCFWNLIGSVQPSGTGHFGSCCSQSPTKRKCVSSLKTKTSHFHTGFKCFDVKMTGVSSGFYLPMQEALRLQIRSDNNTVRNTEGYKLCHCWLQLSHCKLRSPFRSLFPSLFTKSIESMWLSFSICCCVMPAIICSVAQSTSVQWSTVAAGRGAPGALQSQRHGVLWLLKKAFILSNLKAASAPDSFQPSQCCHDHVRDRPKVCYFSLLLSPALLWHNKKLH